MPSLQSAVPQHATTPHVPTSDLTRLPAQRISLGDAGPIAGRYGGRVGLGAVSAELAGEPGLPVVAVLGGISAHAHVVSHSLDERAGWWEWLVGPGKGLDTNQFQVLSVDWATVTGAPTDTADQAAVLAQAMGPLGIPKLYAIIGASYGGMVALTFAERCPGLVERLAVLSAADRTHPMATARRVIQRRIIRLGEASGRHRDGVALARALAITTYRTDAEFAERFGSERVGGDAAPRFPVESYLDHCGERFSATWEADRYCALSESLDLHHCDPAGITVPVSLLGVDGDTIAPPAQMRALRDALAGPATLDVIASRYGHDAFLKEEAAVSSFVRRALDVRRPTPDAPRRTPGARRPTPDGHSATRAVRAGIATDRHHRAVVPPIHLSSTFAFEGFGRKGAYDYTRSGNPTRDHLAEALAELEGGAGGIVKPFELDELFARVRALLRRSSYAAAAGAGALADDDALTFGDLRMDLATREVTRGGRPVELTRTEFTLLEMFLAHPRQVLTREQILKAVWGFDFEPSSNSLDVYVMYLRRKTEAGGEPRLVHTVRGVGYVLRQGGAE